MPDATAVTLPSDQEVQVTRRFDAPRALVWECHTDADLVRRWLNGCDDHEMTVCEIDLRVGGGYHYVWRSRSTGSEFGFRGAYHEIVAPERLVNAEWPDWLERVEGGDAICTLLLTEEEGRTLLVQTMRFPSREVRDQVLATGMTDGSPSPASAAEILPVVIGSFSTTATPT